MKIDPEHFEYLVIQRGEVSDARHDFKIWKKAYEASLSRILESIRPALPDTCARVIDIGSGLGGIDILLATHYGSKGQQPVVCLVDGIDDPPVVEWHHKTFSNMARALDFQKQNGVKYASYFSPRNWPMGSKADLIVSFAAYCFHIPVEDYIKDLQCSTKSGTVLIFDVRKARRDWLEELVRVFGRPQVLEQGEKYVRCAFRVP